MGDKKFGGVVRKVVTSGGNKQVPKKPNTEIGEEDYISRKLKGRELWENFGR
jgi:hypothetical protein